MFAVKGVVKTYAWGSKEKECAVQFFSERQGIVCEEADVPKAELWLGAHPSGPATVTKIVQEERFEERSMDNVLSVQGKGLPFLMKVLSIGAPLSLQLHPDRETAKVLHEEDPEHYTDPYDKPEMCIPLSDNFEMFCGFLKAREIYCIAQTVPFISRLIGESMMAQVGKGVHTSKTTDEKSLWSSQSPGVSEGEFLKYVLTQFYSIDQKEIEVAIEQTLALNLEDVDYSKMKKPKKPMLRELISSFSGVGANSIEANKKLVTSCFSTFCDLQKKYPTDRGCFAAFLLAKHSVKPGQPMGIAANTIHAYLSGECLEIMKCSDNVIRAGLTPKFQDTKKLVELTNYTRYTPAPLKIEQERNDTYELMHIEPQYTESFTMSVLRIPASTTKSLNLSKIIKAPTPVDGQDVSPTEILCLGGCGLMKINDVDYRIESGQCLLLVNQEATTLTPLSEEATEGYMKDGQALVLVFAHGLSEQDSHRKRRTSVTASKLVETKLSAKSDDNPEAKESDSPTNTSTGANETQPKPSTHVEPAEQAPAADNKASADDEAENVTPVVKSTTNPSTKKTPAAETKKTPAETKKTPAETKKAPAETKKAPAETVKATAVPTKASAAETKEASVESGDETGGAQQEMKSAIEEPETGDIEQSVDIEGSDSGVSAVEAL